VVRGVLQIALHHHAPPSFPDVRRSISTWLIQHLFRRVRYLELGAVFAVVVLGFVILVVEMEAALCPAPVVELVTGALASRSSARTHLSPFTRSSAHGTLQLSAQLRGHLLADPLDEQGHLVRHQADVAVR